MDSSTATYRTQRHFIMPLGAIEGRSRLASVLQSLNFYLLYDAPSRKATLDTFQTNLLTARRVKRSAHAAGFARVASPSTDFDELSRAGDLRLTTFFKD
ncbi:MAG: hypothetical protein ACSHYA_17700 [Opitutaceae bacterium]